MGALVLSWGHVVGHQGVLEALEDLSASQKEGDGEDRHHSQVEALGEEVLSCLEVQVDPWEVHMVLWVACPWVGVEACQGVVVPVLGLIQGGQEAEAPCQGEQGAWASVAFLDACCQEGRVVVQVEAQLRPAVDQVLQHLGAFASRGAWMEAWIQEEEQGGNQEAAFLAWASRLQELSALVLEHSAVAERLQTADVVCLPGREGSVQPGDALQPSHVALLWSPS